MCPLYWNVVGPWSWCCTHRWRPCRTRVRSLAAVTGGRVKTRPGRKRCREWPSSTCPGARGRLAGPPKWHGRWMRRRAPWPPQRQGRRMRRRAVGPAATRGNRPRRQAPAPRTPRRSQYGKAHTAKPNGTTAVAHPDSKPSPASAGGRSPFCLVLYHVPPNSAGEGDTAVPLRATTTNRRMRADDYGHRFGR